MNLFIIPDGFSEGDLLYYNDAYIMIANVALKQGDLAYSKYKTLV